MVMLKREIETRDCQVAATTLQLLPTGSDQDSCNYHQSPSFERVFECKSCNRHFFSSQALGGHRAAHKRAKLAHDGPPVSPKVHKCSICGAQFPMGQALGGHMRRHRPEMEAFTVTINKRSSSTGGTKRKLCLDLNDLPPLDATDGEFLGLGLAGKLPLVH